MSLSIHSRSLGFTAVFLATMASAVCSMGGLPVAAVELVLDAKMRHLRNAEPREWTEFPEQAEAKELTYSFEVTKEFRPQTLRLRHRDLRRDWIISLDGQVLIRVPQGDQDATTFWPLPPEKLTPGKHELTIATKDKTPDDVMFGELRLDTRTKAEMLGEAAVEVEVTSPKTKSFAGGAIPCRLTLVDERGSLMTTGIEPERRLAIRPGVIYTLDGNAKFTVPAGKYVLYASRGFEYSVAEMKLDLKAGEVARPRLVVKHELDNHSLVGIDTHVHTLTHSGHGDCTIEERVVTLAGEGVAAAVATDHNKIIAYGPTLERLGAEHDVSVIVGDEVTTKVGHFNVFPLQPNAPAIDHSGTTWAEIDAAIKKAGGETTVVLNHARDIHNGFRPFGTERHIAVAGEDVTGWILPANAMEIFNSGSTQSDAERLFHDWLGLLNRGIPIKPIGSSDSHDVSRYIVGQGRTYNRTNRLGEYEVVGASMGLLCVIKQSDPVFLADSSDNSITVIPKNGGFAVSVEVLRPSWIEVGAVRLFVNGREVAEKPETSKLVQGHGNDLSYNWLLPKLQHDVHVVALASGPGVDKPYWPVAKPYQPNSPDWKSYVIGCSAAIRIDADGDSRYSSPYDYAQKLFVIHRDDDAKLVAALKDYDEAVAVQAASVARAAGKERFESFLDAVAKQGAPQTKTGANKYVAGWRATLVGTTTPGASPAPVGEKK